MRLLYPSARRTASAPRIAPLYIGNGCAEHEGIMFVINGSRSSPLSSPVVVIGGESFQIRLEYSILNPPVEIEDLRLILVNQLAAADQPVFQIHFRRGEP